MPYEKETIRIGERSISRAVLPAERAHALWCDSALALSTLPALSEGREAYARDVLMRLFNTMLRRYPKILRGPLEASIGTELALFGAYAPHASLHVPSYTTSEQFLTEAYQALDRVVPESPPFADYATGDFFAPDGSWRYQTIGMLARRLSGDPHIASAMLHGSFGSRDYLPEWSDLDVLVVLRDSAFAHPAALKALRNRLAKLSLACYKIDPLAHHEFLAVTELDMKSYARPLYPPELFAYGMRLAGPPALSIAVRDDRYDRVQALFRTLQHVRRRLVRSAAPGTAFSWKNDLSIMMIWPTLLLEAHDQFVYKRESFDAVRTLFPDTDFSVFDRLGAVRRAWEARNWVRWYPDALIEHLPAKMSLRATQVLKRPSLWQSPPSTPEERRALLQDFAALAEDTFARTLARYA